MPPQHRNSIERTAPWELEARVRHTRAGARNGSCQPTRGQLKLEWRQTDTVHETGNIRSAGSTALGDVVKEVGEKDGGR